MGERPSKWSVKSWTLRLSRVTSRRFPDKLWPVLLLIPRPRRSPRVWWAALDSKSLRYTSKRCSSVISTRFLVILFTLLLVLPPRHVPTGKIDQATRQVGEVVETKTKERDIESLM